MPTVLDLDLDKNYIQKNLTLVAGDIPDLSASYQPRDSDLDAIAALATTVYGRNLLTRADANADRAVIFNTGDYQVTATTRPTVRSTGSALVTNDLWFETSKGITWTWDGTRWLSSEYQTVTASGQTAPGGNVIAGATTAATVAYITMEIPAITAVYGLAVLDISSQILRIGAQGSTGYWSLATERLNSSAVATATGSAFNFNTTLASGGFDVVALTSSINTIYTSATTTAFWRMRIDKVGAVACGGIANYSITMRYRLVRV